MTLPGILPVAIVRQELPLAVAMLESIAGRVKTLPYGWTAPKPQSSRLYKTNSPIFSMFIIHLQNNLWNPLDSHVTMCYYHITNKEEHKKEESP